MACQSALSVQNITTLTLLYLIVGREIYIRSEKDIILICDIVTGCTFVDKR